MQSKQKVTLYIPPELHRKLKIKAAIDTESMSNLVEKAISFYLQYPDRVEDLTASAYGKTHQIHICPECDSAMVMRDGSMVSLKSHEGILSEDISLSVSGQESTPDRLQGEEELVPC
jgi:hypothetical protein